MNGRSDPPGRLRALVEVAFAPSPDEAPEATLARLEVELAACFAALLATYRTGEPPISMLTAIAEAMRDRSRTLPPEVERAHLDWLALKNRWYKPVLGPDGSLQRPPGLPEGRLCVALALVPLVFAAIRELQYAHHRGRHAASCDCAALIAGAIDRRPASPDLRRVGPHCDGYYTGDELRCGACGTRWFCGVRDDSLGSTFWEPIDASPPRD